MNANLKPWLSLTSGTAVLSILLSGGGGAWAQDNDQRDKTLRTLDEIVVTATRRSGVTVQDVPIAVSAYNEDLLNDTGFKRLDDIEQISPSVQISPGESAATGTQLSIRGVGTSSNNPGFEPAVGVIIDGVFRTRTGIAMSELPELQSIEVLRGPQGTLFGRNTSAGAISINTKKPQFESEVVVGATVANFNGVTTEFSATGALSENWAGRIDTKHRERDGYVTDINSGRDYNNVNRQSLRGQLLYTGDNSEFRLIADWAQIDENCCIASHIAGGSTEPIVEAAAGILGIDGIYNGDPFDYNVAISPNRDYREDVEEWGISAQYDHEFDFGNLTAISAYRDWGVVRDQDVDFSGIDRVFRKGLTSSDKTFTQEVRLQGVRGNIDWIVGGFYMHQKTELFEPLATGTQGQFYVDALYNASLNAAFQDPTSPFFGADAFFPNGVQVFGSLGPASAVPSFLALVNPSLAGTFIPDTPGGAAARNIYKTTTNAFALFTHNEITLSEKTTLTVGLRFNHETKNLTENLNQSSAACDFINNDPLGPTAVQLLSTAGLLVCSPMINNEVNGTLTDKHSEDEFTGTLKLSHDITPDLMTYGAYSRGYKSGGFNLDQSALSFSAFGGAGPSTSDQEFDAEIVDAFEIGVKSTWLDGLLTINGAVFYQQISGFQENVFTGANFRVFNVDVEAKGVEIDVLASPAAGLVLQGGFAYTDTSKEHNIEIPDGVGGATVLAEAGAQLRTIPKYVFTGSGTYTFDILPGLEGILHLNIRYNSSTAVTDLPSIRPFLVNDAYAVIGARVGVIGDDGRWELSVFGENITQQEYLISGFTAPEQTAIIAYPGTPRFYGIEGKVRF